MKNGQSLKRSLFKFYGFTLLTMALGSGFALYTNWIDHLQSSKTTLGRDATITTNFIESSLVSASKSLDIAQIQLTTALHAGKFNRKTVYSILNISVNEFTRYNPTDIYGLLFFVDKAGQLYARSGEFPTQQIDFTDRFYYQDLRDHPEKTRTIGPLLKARTTGKYVFHIAVPITDTHGKFFGVLVQQIQTNDLDDLLGKALNGNAEQVVMHHPEQGVSFVRSTANGHQAPANAAMIAQLIAESNLKHGCIQLDSHQLHAADTLLVGFTQSNNFGFITSTSLPLKLVFKQFLQNNRYLLLYIFLGLLFVSYLFFRLYRQHSKLEQTQFVSRHDALTKLHNRWALNEELPVLLHEAMRRQSPISFLFIDIDHFKAINDNFGHEIGDLALSSTAKAIENCLRRPLDFLCRWGGEEFVLIMPDTSEDSAIMLAELMMNAVKNIKIKDCDLKITISIGISTSYITLHNITYEHINDAEEAMMMAKKNGRDRYFIFAHNHSA